MQISLTKTPFYYQTTWESKTRTAHIEKAFHMLNLFPVFAPYDTNKLRSGALGQIRVLDAALRNQERKRKFQPFALLENDANIFRPFPTVLEIPDDADIVYIGISKASIAEQAVLFENFGYDYDQNYIKTHHMLATHGLLFCSLKGVTIHANSMLEALHNKLPWDFILARIQGQINAYALKRPLVYQDSRLGGQEWATRFRLKKVKDPTIVPQISTITGHCMKPIHYEDT